MRIPQMKISYIIICFNYYIINIFLGNFKKYHIYNMKNYYVILNSYLKKKISDKFFSTIIENSEI